MKKKLLQIFAIVLILLSAGVLCFSGIQIQSGLYELLPSKSDESVRSLERLAEESSRQVNILIKGKDENSVLAQALHIRQSLPADIRPMTDEKSLQNIAELLKPYRFQLLAARHRLQLKNKQTDELLEEALSNLYSFIPVSLYSVESDPYGFATAFLMENPLVRQNGFEPRNGVMLTQRDGVHYAYLPLLLPETVNESLDNLNACMVQISALCQEPGVMLCGTPVHTWRASSTSQQSMGLLSLFSTLMVIALFLCVFRSLRGMLIMCLTLATAGVISLGLISLLYDSVHILSLVFGCSLMGIASDYMVHYLVGHHKQTDSGISPVLRRALLLGLLTSVIGYSTFYLTRVELLGQIATISVIGLAATMLLIFAFYPLLYTKHVPILIGKQALRLGDRISGWSMSPVLPWLFAACFLILSLWRLSVCDDLRSFYRPEADLLQAEKTLAGLNGMDKGMTTIVVRGHSAEEILQRQEQLGELLESTGVSTYTSVASLIPSAARQHENFDMVRQLVEKHAAEVPLDFPAEWGGALTPEQLMKSDSPFLSLKSLWDEKSGLMLVPALNDAQRAALLQHPWAEISNRIDELQEVFRKWRIQLIEMLIIVGILILCVLTFFYGMKNSLRMMGPVFAAVLSVFGTLATFGIALSLFHVLACYLLLGLGCDYAIFRASTAEKNGEISLAVTISFLTSLAMFGVLSFTSFSVTQDMGIAISIGLTVAYVLSPAATGAAVRRCKGMCDTTK